MTRTPKLEMSKSSNNQFYFELIWGNWQTILTSETYTTESSCKRAMKVSKDRMKKAK